MKKILVSAVNKGVVVSEIYKYIFPNIDYSILKSYTLTVECRRKDGKRVVVLKSNTS